MNKARKPLDAAPDKRGTEVHPIVQALREALREMAKKLTPDVPPADVYTPGEYKRQ